MRLVVKEDWKTINEWRSKRSIHIIPDSLYPPTGLIEPNVAAGFINFTQTNTAFFENFVSNPDADKKEREDAIMKISESLEKMAYDYGIKWIVAVTNQPKIESYIYRCKWKKLPYSAFAKEL